MVCCVTAWRFFPMCVCAFATCSFSYDMNLVGHLIESCENFSLDLITYQLSLYPGELFNSVVNYIFYI